MTKNTNWTKSVATGLLVGAAVLGGSAYAMSESSVQSYAAAMNQAANSQNIGQISRLIADDAIIQMKRNGNTADLSKNAYLQHLQKSWAKAKNYHYNMTVSDVVITGSQARVHVETIETWTEDGKPVKLATTSKATLSEVDSNAILLRSSSQVTIN